MFSLQSFDFFPLQCVFEFKIAFKLWLMWMVKFPFPVLKFSLQSSLNFIYHKNKIHFHQLKKNNHQKRIIKHWNRINHITKAQWTCLSVSALLRSFLIIRWHKADLYFVWYFVWFSVTLQNIILEKGPLQSNHHFFYCMYCRMALL